jgi:amino acid permease
MENAPYQKLLTPVHHIIGIILTSLVFVLMSILLVPVYLLDQSLIAQGQACLTAVPITAVFWFAYNMFMVVLLDQKKQKRRRSSRRTRLPDFHYFFKGRPIWAAFFTEKFWRRPFANARTC